MMKTGESKGRAPGGRIAVYPGSFDPVTNGHVDILERALRLFDCVIVSAVKAGSKPLFFPLKKRIEFLEASVRELPDVYVDYFDGLLVDYVIRKKACAVIRGLRAVSDFEYEFQMALMNRRLSRKVETVFLMPSEQHTFVSSRLAREVAAAGGDLSSLVSPTVAAALQEALAQ